MTMTITEQQISEIENYILDLDTVMQEQDYVEPATVAILRVDERIHEITPLINSETPPSLVKRLQLCAHTLMMLSEKAQSQLEDVRQAVIKLQNSKKGSLAYKDTTKHK